MRKTKPCLLTWKSHNQWTSLSPKTKQKSRRYVIFVLIKLWKTLKPTMRTKNIGIKSNWLRSPNWDNWILWTRRNWPVIGLLLANSPKHRMLWLWSPWRPMVWQKEILITKVGRENVELAKCCEKIVCTLRKIDKNDNICIFYLKGLSRARLKVLIFYFELPMFLHLFDIYFTILIEISLKVDW